MHSYILFTEQLTERENCLVMIVRYYFTKVLCVDPLIFTITTP